MGFANRLCGTGNRPLSHKENTRNRPLCSFRKFEFFFILRNRNPFHGETDSQQNNNKPGMCFTVRQVFR